MKFLTLCLAFSGFQLARSLEAAAYQTIECSLYQSSLCFNSIAKIGGNFTARYAQSAAELNATCRQKQFFENCIGSVPETCYNRNSTIDSTIASIVDFVTKICTNKSETQNNFLNSSKCYNKYQQRRSKCERTHSSTNRDSKSLCCQSFKIQDCLKSDLNNVCSKNATAFQDKLIDTYSSYVNFLCSPYKKQCNSATTNYASLLSVLLALKFYFIYYVS